MRSLFLIAALALPYTALAQATAPAPPASKSPAGPAMTPAPVPACSPRDAPNWGATMPPERVAPAARAGDRSRIGTAQRDAVQRVTDHASGNDLKSGGVGSAGGATSPALSK